LCPFESSEKHKQETRKLKTAADGGSHAELPLIRAAQQAGWHVTTVGLNIKGLGHVQADQYIPCDFSDPDQVLAVARQINAEAVVSGCNDFAYLSTAYVCEKMALPGHDCLAVAETIHHKDKFRNLLADLHLPHPQYLRCNNLDEVRQACQSLRFPLMIKPADLTGGKGVKICHTESESLEAAHVAFDKTRRSYLVAESFISGSNHGFSALLQKQKVVFYFHDNERYGLNPYLVAGAEAPGDLLPEVIENLIRQVETIAEHLHLVDGLFHFQFVLSDTGVPYIIDPCRRAPGDLYIQLVCQAAGIDYATMIVRAECGLKMGEIKKPVIHGFHARECIMADRCGKLEAIEIAPEIQIYLTDKLIWGRPGDVIEDPLTYKAGILFFKFDTKQQLSDLISQFNKYVYVKVKRELTAIFCHTLLSLRKNNRSCG
jgi:biotin carboxylase